MLFSDFSVKIPVIMEYQNGCAFFTNMRSRILKTKTNSASLNTGTNETYIAKYIFKPFFLVYDSKSHDLSDRGQWAKNCVLLYYQYFEEITT
jgi:hypothetical protein